MYHDFEESQSLKTLNEFKLYHFLGIIFFTLLLYLHTIADPEMYLQFGDNINYVESYAKSSN